MSSKRSSSGSFHQSPDDRLKRFRDSDSSSAGSSLKSRLGGFAQDNRQSSVTTQSRLGPALTSTRSFKPAVSWNQETSERNESSRSSKPESEYRRVSGLARLSSNGDGPSIERRLSNSNETRKEEKEIPKRRSEPSSQLSTTPLESRLNGVDVDVNLTTGLVDTHMHIDFTLSYFGLTDSSWSKFSRKVSSRFPSCYEGAIAVFCQPDSFICSSPMLNEAFESDRLWMTFGVHPHFADQYSENSLRACLHKFKKKIVALGEIGLDTSRKNHVSLEVQKEVFRSQAEIGIECELPLVIHTRVKKENEETLQFMRKFVPKNYRMHRHCFTGTLDEANDWLSQFKNCYIGFTPLINTQPELMKVAAHIPFDRILLETDAPYFKNGLPPHTDGVRASGTVPGDVIYTAAGVAKARGLPIEAVICQTRLNAKNIYGF